MDIIYAVVPVVLPNNQRRSQVVFPFGKVDVSRLTAEIQQSDITIALGAVVLMGTDCLLHFKADLSPSEITVLDAIVAVHSGEPLTVTPQPVETYSGAVPAPVAADGKPFTLPNCFPGEVLLNFAGARDVLSPPHRFEGELFGLQQTGPGDTAVMLDFLDGIFLAGGHIEWDGGSWGSSVYMELVAPATTVKDPAVPGKGNCNLVTTPYGFHIIVPAAGDGQKDIDVPVPVPSYDNETNAQTGYWNYSEPWVGTGVMSPGVPGQAKYNLFDAPLELAHFTKLHLFKVEGGRDLIAPAIKPKWILPEWKMKVTITNANTDPNTTFRVAWDLLIARRKSV